MSSATTGTTRPRPERSSTVGWRHQSAIREPWYQQGVPNQLARQNQQPGEKVRAVPDIATVGYLNTGMLIGITQTFPHFTGYSEYRIGGTSLFCPLLAGMMALADSMAG